MKTLLFCLSLSVVLVSGCGILSKEPYRPVNYYDLNCKSGIQEVTNLRISEVTAARPYSEKMVFRISDNRLEIDEFNRWADAPSSLVRKYLILSFQNKSADLPAQDLKAEIMQFEADMVKHSVKVMLQVTVSGKNAGQSRIYSQEVPLDKVTGESFAKGAEIAISKIVEQIAKDIGGKQ